MENLSYYEILEVSQTSDKETIKKAYRSMAKKYHPDKNAGMQMLNINLNYVTKLINA